jgi:hypothetical protein
MPGARLAWHKAQKEQSMSNNPRQALLATVKAQGAEITRLQGVIASLARTQGVQEIQVGYIANLAGVSQQVEAIKKKADADNPAQPVPNPASEQPFETTEQAVTPETYDNVENPGMTPGSTNNIGADTTDVALNPGESLPTSPFNQLENVQAPVAGTETQLPLNQTRIETDVRVGPQASPSANPQVAYPWTLSKRTFASINLARLQIQAGLAEEKNDLVLGEKIATSEISDQEIQSTINTLAGVAKVATKQSARPAGLVPRSASVQRTTPSLAGGNAAPLQVTSASVSDDTADADLFF